MAIRSESLWLTLAALRDEDFGDGVPWMMAAQTYTELERIGFVKRVTLGNGERAVATDAGLARLDALRRLVRARNARRQQKRSV